MEETAVSPWLLPEVLKSRKMLLFVLEVSKKITTFAAMKYRPYVITAVSRLTGRRMEVSRHIPKDKALSMLEIIRVAEPKRYAAYTRYRVEPVLPKQLLIPFDYD